MASLSQKKQSKGFTLVEMLTTIFIFSTIIGGVTLLLQNILKSSQQQPLALETVDQARIVTANFVNELRNANSGNDGSYALNQAADAQIIFYSTYGSATSTQTNRLRYYVSGTTLYKGVTTPNGNPLSYNPASEKTTTLINNIRNASTPVFYYFNGSSTPLVQQVNLNDVKFVEMNLIIPTQDVRGATTTFTVTAGATIRSLKTNLGN
jgi:prepilin-type N-terminal cleavage/methylation domain-containing protein